MSHPHEPTGPAEPVEPIEPSAHRDLLPELREAGESLPGLARVAASAAWHTTGWGVRTSARAWLRVGRAVTDRDEAAALAREAATAIAAVGEIARAASTGTPLGKALVSAGSTLGGMVPEPVTEVINGQVVSSRAHHDKDAEPTLRERGQELLHKSRDVWSTDQGHPAFGRILSEVAPDEARILMLLLNKGPQPSVDVRTGGPVGMVSSQLIAPGLTMIGPRAGCRYVDQVPSYLNNLFRLGLIWFSRESLRDPMEYQVVEAQPDVLAAMHSVKFAKVVRRSIHLTPFGEDFCRTCLVEEEVATAEFPEHGTPGDGEAIEAH
ncbi:Abi-alpha family protein [Nocardioides sp.]|uniref:Abi-alpha family protein n=1 Tax=Nocardioides sp. TaxID=35761 RepID=UPI002723C514|nr:Abi-alpha family protein [Nocardioides sp.]MDO9456977.1 Abi-alpha family protein [Nocardioides sp.]